MTFTLTRLLAFWAASAGTDASGAALVTQGGCECTDTSCECTTGGCECKAVTTDFKNSAQWVGCGKDGWCDVVDGCSSARDKKQGYVGWDFCASQAYTSELANDTHREPFEVLQQISLADLLDPGVDIKSSLALWFTDANSPASSPVAALSCASAGVLAAFALYAACSALFVQPARTMDSILFEETPCKGKIDASAISHVASTVDPVLSEETPCKPMVARRVLGTPQQDCSPSSIPVLKSSSPSSTKKENSPSAADRIR
jgi:hypothetical protein